MSTVKEAKQAKNPKGTVAVEVVDSRLRLRWRYDGKQYAIRIGLPDTKVNRSVAQRKATQIELDIVAGHFDTTLQAYKNRTQRTQTSLLQVWERFIAYKAKTITPKTLEKYQVTSRIVQEFFFGRWAESIGLNEADRFCDWVQQQDLSPSQKRRRLEEVRACWEWAVKQGILKENPWLEVTTRLKVPPQQRPKPFTEEEIRLVLNAFQNSHYYSHYYPYVRFLLTTGCRPGEAVGLQWKHLNDDCSVVWVGEAVVKNKRQAAKANKDRTVGLPESLQVMLLEMRPEKYSPEDLVFASPRGKVIDIHNFRNRAWVDILKEAGIPYRKPYITRSTCASHSLEQGLSPMTVAQMLGHSKVDVIYDHYAGSVVSRPTFLELRGLPRNRD